MNTSEILEALKQQSPQLLGTMPDKRAEAIIAATLRAVKQAIDSVEEGALPVAALGRFVIKQVTNKTDGTVNRVVILRSPKPKA